jgi:hypothetical protein
MVGVLHTPRPGAAHPDRSAPGLGSRLSFATPPVRSSPDYSTFGMVTMPLHEALDYIASEPAFWIHT